MLTPEQIEQRLNYVTGSDAAVICGLSPYMNIIDLFLIKTRQKVAPDISNNPHIKAGNYLEDVVARMFFDECRPPLNHQMIGGNLFINKKHKWMAGNIDRYIDSNTLLECKTSSTYDGWGELGDDTTIPKHYLLQCAHYCAVTGAQLCYIAVLFHGVDFRIYKYHRNLELEAKLIERERIFWEEHVLKGICPEPTTENEVKSMLMDLSDEPLIADEGVEQAIEEYREHKAIVTAHQILAQNAKDKICAAMKEKQYLVDSFGKPLATWKKSKPVIRFNAKELEKDMPEIYQKYCAEGEPVRTFRLKENNK